MVQRILKPEDKVLIFVDYREENKIAEYMKDMGAIIKSIPLRVGDYLCSDRVCIERKTGDDFISSITDGRLFEQAKELKENFSKPILLIEGNYWEERMNENAIKSALAAILLDFEVPIVMTRHEEETARTIFWIAKREQMVKKMEIGISGKKKPKEIKELQEYFISGLPGISTVLTRRILNEFKTIKNFACAKENEISRVKGIGKNLAKKLYRIFNEEYGGNV